MGTPLAKLKEQIIAGLGGAIEGTPAGAAVVGVELTDQQFDVAVKLAKQWFTARKGFTVYRPLVVADGQSEYYMDADVQQVLDVVFSVPADVSAFFTMGFFDIIPYGPQGIAGLGSNSQYSGFVQLLMFSEQRKRVFSVEPEWDYDQQTRVLRIPSHSGLLPGIVMVKAKLNDFDPSRLFDKDSYIFDSWVRAKAKEIVGRIRSKYDSLPAAGGITSMDGKELIAEAKEEFAQLDKEIFASQGPDGMHVG